MLGVFISSFGIALMLKCKLGNIPTATMIQGVSILTGFSYGIAGLLVNFTFLIPLFIFDKSKIFIGTLVSTFLFGYFIDLSLFILSPINFDLSYSLRILITILGIGISAIGLGYYVEIGFGIGALDGIFVILNNKFKIPLGYAKSIKDVSLLILGALLGASIGVGTIIALAVIGPVMSTIISIIKRNKNIEEEKEII